MIDQAKNALHTAGYDTRELSLGFGLYIRRRRIWILGASDPEMGRIEAGEHIAYALVGDDRVHAGNAYRAAHIGRFDYVEHLGVAPGTWYLVECRYGGGFRAAKPRAPTPGPGNYRFKILGCSEGYNPGKSRSSFKIRLEIVDSDTDLEAGTEVMITFPTSQAGLSRVKSFVMAAAGFAEESMYDEFDPGKFIEAQLLEGRLVDCFVDQKTLQSAGHYYYEYTWRVVGDQDMIHEVAS